MSTHTHTHILYLYCTYEVLETLKYSSFGAGAGSKMS